MAVDSNGKSTCVSFTEFSIWTSRQVLVTQTSPRNPTQKGLGTRVYRELYSLSLYIFFTWPYKWIISSLKCSIPEQHIICCIWGLVFELRSPEGLSVQITYRNSKTIKDMKQQVSAKYLWFLVLVYGRTN